MRKLPPVKLAPVPIRIDKVRARRLFFYLWQVTAKGRNLLFILASVIIAGGLLFSLFDGKSLAEGQYLSFITALTIGYGDLSPVTWPARIVSGVVGINGVLLTGVIVAFVLKALELTFREDIEQIEQETDDAAETEAEED